MGTFWVLTHIALPWYKYVGVVVIWSLGGSLLLYILHRFGRYE